MSLYTRIRNVFRTDRLNREIDAELQSHLDEAVEQGRDPAEARRAFGSALRQREESRDFRLLPWLDSLRADAFFGWRQLWKRKVTSAAAILSLALAIGACTSAFRLIDALLLRPLPVTNPQQLYYVFREGIGPSGQPISYDGWAYPGFQLMRDAVKDQGEMIAVSYAERLDLTYKSDNEMEKAYIQYVSGWMFPSFGLQPAAGRLFTADDDRKPGAHPYAVISYDYWTRRFGQDASVIGRTFRLGDRIFEIVGVGPERFTGTETGTVVDVFLPTMMHSAAERDDNTWHRAIFRLKSGASVEQVRERLQASSHAFELERAKGFKGMTKEAIEKAIDQTVKLESASAGASGLQQDYRRSLMALGVLVALVLLIACANVANLMTAQGAARAREMALRVSIGAGRARLLQLVFVESAILALLSGATGGLFAWWSAPFVVSRINPADNPARLSLPWDWRVFAFGLALTLVVTLLFGLAPALRASSVKPANALKGGEDPHSRRRLMHALIAVQVAFCFLVLFVAGLFAATFDRLSNKPVGFSAERLLVLDTVPARPQSAVAWQQVADRLRDVPGVESVAISGWTLLTPNGWNGFISVNGGPPGPTLAFFLNVTPGWIGTMRLPLVEGRDFRPEDTSPGSALVNETFVKYFFNGGNPIGQSIAKGEYRYQVVGVIHDAPYRSLREPIAPMVLVPFRMLDSKGAERLVPYGAFLVKTKGANPLNLASALRSEVPRANAGFRVSNISTQEDINKSHTVRERLLAMLALFFAAVALLLAAIGLYGVLDYSVLQRRREIGIRMAIGAQAGDIARRVTSEVFAMVILGAVAGLAAGLASTRSIESLLYGVSATDPAMLALPALTIALAALLSAVPAVIRAVRIDPATML
ncbi:MAG: ADOP family duplicated permease, partial [Bryobacteraceae bacterium]